MEDKSYFERLEEARQYSKEQIVNEHPWILDIRGYINCYFTHTTDSLQHNVIDGANMQYQALLLGSFMRTHYVLYELILLSSNIEAATLTRKQIELISRIKELDTKDVDTLSKKTPNIKHSRHFNRDYGILSEIAHSSSLDSLDVMGFKMVDESHKMFYMQPTYTGDTIELLRLWLALFVEFIFCSMDIKASIIPEYDASWDIKFSRRLFRYGKDNDIMLLKGIYESLDEKSHF